jgi:transposase-like protein
MAISFKGAHFPPDIILMGVRWYVAYPLNLLSAPLTIPLIYRHINSFRRASRCGEAMARRRKYDRRTGIVSRGI